MIVVKLQGGLGNQMFQYAIGRNLADKYNTELRLDISALDPNTENLPRRIYALSEFYIRVTLIDQKKIPRKGIFYPFRKFFSSNSLFYFAEKSTPFDERIRGVKDNSYLDGYWQSEKYFKESASVLHKEFTHKHIPEDAKKILDDKIISQNSVGIHVRRGDYIDNPSTNKLHGICDMEYFDKAVSIIKSRVVNPKFYIFTDDIDWCRQNMQSRYGAEIVDSSLSGRFSELHLILLSKCKHQILSNSSFSWWAAWLNINPTKIVIVPNKWITKPEKTEDRFCSGWLPI